MLLVHIFMLHSFNVANSTFLLELSFLNRKEILNPEILFEAYFANGYNIALRV